MPRIENSLSRDDPHGPWRFRVLDDDRFRGAGLRQTVQCVLQIVIGQQQDQLVLAREVGGCSCRGAGQCFARLRYVQDPNDETAGVHDGEQFVLTVQKIVQLASRTVRAHGGRVPIRLCNRQVPQRLFDAR